MHHQAKVGDGVEIGAVGEFVAAGLFLVQADACGLSELPPRRDRYDFFDSGDFCEGVYFTCTTINLRADAC